MPLLNIDIAAQFAKFQDALNQVESSSKKAADSISGAFGGVKTVLGAIGVGLSIDFFKNLVEGSIDAAAHLEELSKATKLSAEELAGFKLVAKQSGSDIDSLGLAMARLSANIGKNPEKFATLGLSAKDPLEAFKQLSDIFVKLEDTDQRNAVAATALGKAWFGAAPALALGGERIAEIVKRGGELSGITEANAAASKKFKDQMAELSTTLEGTRTKLVERFLPAMKDVADAMQHGAEESGILGAAFSGLEAIATRVFEAFAKVKNQGKLFDLGDQIEVLQKQLKSGTLNPDPKGFWARLIPDVKLPPEQKKKIEERIAELQEETQRLSGVLKPPKLDTPSGQESPLLAAIRDNKKALEAEEAAAKAASFLKKDKSVLERDRSAEAEGKLADARAKILIEAEKFSAESQLEVLSKFHADGLISEKFFWDSREKVQEKAFAVELQAAKDDVTARGLLVAKPREDSTGADRINNQRLLEEAQAREAKLQAQRSRDVEQGAIDRVKSERDAADQILSLTSIAFDELLGNTEKATIARLNIQNRLLHSQLSAAGDIEGEKRLRVLEQSQISQARLNDLEANAIRIRFDAAAIEERINIAAHQGSLTQLEADRVTSNARQQELVDLKAILEAKKKAAEASPNNLALQDQVKALTLEIDKLAASADVVREKFQNIFGNAFTSAIDALQKGDFKGALKAFSDSLISGINRETTKGLSDKLFGEKGLLGDLTTTVSEFFSGKKAPIPAVSDTVAKLAGKTDQVASTTAANTALQALAASSETAATSGELASASFEILNTSLESADVQIFALSEAASAAAAALLEVAASSGASSLGKGAGAIGSLLGEAHGDAFIRGKVIPFATGGIVATPTVFRMANQVGMLGEAGPEAIVPLSRGRDGRLGIAGGQSSQVVHLTIQTPDVGSFTRSESQIVSQAARMMARAQRNM